MEEKVNAFEAEIEEIKKSSLDERTKIFLCYLLDKERLPPFFKVEYSEILKQLPLVGKLLGDKQEDEPLIHPEDTLDNAPTQYRGKVLIINELDYSSEDKRHGSEQDKKKLKELFKKLIYDVKPKKNVPSQEMINVIQSEAEAGSTNIFICCILAHGDTGVIKCTDGGTVKLKDIVHCLKDKTADDVLKIFIIQACQGPMIQRIDGSNIRSVTEEGVRPNSDQLSGAKGTVLVKDQTLEDKTERYFLPLDALPKNVFCFLSSVVPYKACRKINGSPFIKALVSNITEHHQENSVEEIGVMVNREIACEEFEDCGVRYKQMCCFISSLRKPFKF